MVPQSYEASLGAQAYRDDVLTDPKVQASQDPAQVTLQKVSAGIIEAAKRS
jgi:hypothetical protein